MNTRIIFSTDVKLKKQVAKKAKSDGLTVTAVLNSALRSYADGRLAVGAFDA